MPLCGIFWTLFFFGGNNFIIFTFWLSFLSKGVFILLCFCLDIYFLWKDSFGFFLIWWVLLLVAPCSCLLLVDGGAEGRRGEYRGQVFCGARGVRDFLTVLWRRGGDLDRSTFDNGDFLTFFFIGRIFWDFLWFWDFLTILQIGSVALQLLRSCSQRANAPASPDWYSISLSKKIHFLC